MPDGIELPVALAALHDGTTALGTVEKANLQEGEHVLVTVAAGSLGGWLIPAARSAGARVIATARGERKLERVRELGADTAVDYTDDDWTLQVVDATGGRGVDVVFDGAGGATGGAAFDLVVPGGRFFAYGAASGDFAAIEPAEAEARGITVVGIDEGMSAGDRVRLARQALAATVSGSVRPLIGAAYPLEQADQAHAAIEARSVVGKTVLKL
ncbi:zinc-binding dehydrogenase [Phytoactinopolyspora halotolerans]|uniref:zinc-binding dehydrogenase n=1 Tax=Phytoactinopolyspora halotolerans TaxID=1981512 RepID=UPI001C206334|nr:zinc-binding dehydrogenase [Phytoactinopolyspora halotolerans]